MKIVVKLFANLRDFGPKYQELEVPDDFKLIDLINKLGIPEKYPMIKLINGEFAELNTSLKEGDTISLFPPIAGG
ncbi:MAG: MoaD/ThiS family protein [Proteobacteria bacterium]|nr:MoaD/ThiS family protein [Pseudomonadota bacterium]